jgi:hypothetical protein
MIGIRCGAKSWFQPRGGATLTSIVGAPDVRSYSTSAKKSLVEFFSPKAFKKAHLGLLASCDPALLHGGLQCSVVTLSLIRIG